MKHKKTILFIALFFLIVNIALGQLLRINYFDDNGITFNYHIDYENTIRKNKVKKATSSNVQYGNSTMYEYNKNGQIIKTDRQPDSDNNGIRKYNNAGQLVEKYHIDFVSKINDTLKITKYEYDEKGKINKKIIWHKKKTEFNHSDYTKSKRYTNKLEELKYINSYNAKNQLVKQLQFSADTLFGSMLYEYDENGNLIDFKILYKDNNVNIHYVLKYDLIDRVISIKLMNSFDGIIRNIIYNEKGQVISAFKKVEYNPNALIKTISHYSENEGVSIVNHFKYEYFK